MGVLWYPAAAVQLNLKGGEHYKHRDCSDLPRTLTVGMLSEQYSVGQWGLNITNSFPVLAWSTRAVMCCFLLMRPCISVCHIN
jgi:hypothetical protein